MKAELILNIDCYGFPEHSEVAHMLFWMGQDYRQHVIETVRREFQNEIVAIKCEKFPEFNTVVGTLLTNRVKSISVSFDLQVLAKRIQHGHERVQTALQFEAKNLHKKPSFTHEMAILNNEII
jgi:hypothetical protein